ncbi:hypothetical protein BAY01_13475 [Elizabethkingia miricola]|nr:hypothetical protein BAY01_13475 [Elizabethkingia miricola]
MLVLDTKKQKSDNSFSNNTNHSNQIKMQTKKKNDENLSEETSEKEKNYISPEIHVLYVEMENGIAANSGTALPASTNTPVNETWDNADVTPDQPIYW